MIATVEQVVCVWRTTARITARVPTATAATKWAKVTAMTTMLTTTGTTRSQGTTLRVPLAFSYISHKFTSTLGLQFSPRIVRCNQ